MEDPWPVEESGEAVSPNGIAARFHRAWRAVAAQRIQGASLRLAIGFDGFTIRHGGQEPVEVRPTAGGGFATEIFESAKCRHLLGGSAGQKLIDGISLLGGQRLDAPLERFGKFDSQFAHDPVLFQAPPRPYRA